MRKFGAIAVPAAHAAGYNDAVSLEQMNWASQGPSSLVAIRAVGWPK